MRKADEVIMLERKFIDRIILWLDDSIAADSMLIEGEHGFKAGERISWINEKKETLSGKVIRIETVPVFVWTGENVEVKYNLCVN
jgi:hypothetical protein